MSREWALKIVMVVSGLLFLAAVYPLAMSLWQWQHVDVLMPMFLSLYVTLGAFLLMAVRNPSEHRSLIGFAAWSSFAHAGVMLVQAYGNIAGRPELFGMSAILVVIGVPLIALMPRKPSTASAVASRV
ncbi:hypothetical protein IHE49_07155 [Rhodanobacter sp. 7MK24]|uniref:DUF6632 domain-containing protein n=1 Tax=Rhodanobacter sp. 7MK24 TaxID=2775922 RepID=UPI0017820C03|nr:DUF6632 domain-containing protein [Rhodanobacter sp. 7MK24]MBD8880254.1 hypothetical protein [Rhodanobacter sp. 7MK24]